MSKPKILIITPSLGSGGAQKVFKDQLDFYSKHFDTHGCIFNWDGALENERGLDMISLEVSAGKNVISKFYFFCQRVIRLRKIKRQYKIDIAISHLEGADYINILSGGREKIVCYIHGTKFHDGEIKGLLGWIRKVILMPVLYRYSDLIIAVSSGIKKELVSQLGIASDKVKVITNGFDVKRIELLANESIPSEAKNLLEQNNTIALCSRLAPQKNQEIFLSVFSELKKKMDCKLIILGDGELQNALIQKARNLNLKVFSVWDGIPMNNQFDVYFLGNQLNPFSYLIKSTVFALPSAWEGFPLALCEAMACELPVVASDCPTGPAEILQNTKGESRYGFLLPIPRENQSNDLQRWVETLLTLLKNNSLAKEYGIKAKERVLEFSFDRMEQDWLNVVDDLKE